MGKVILLFADTGRAILLFADTGRAILIFAVFITNHPFEFTTGSALYCSFSSL
jgi:hypothetical protein